MFMLHLETNEIYDFSDVITFKGEVNSEACDDHAQGIESSKLFTVRKYRDHRWKQTVKLF